MCWIYLGNRKAYTLVDTGADISIVSQEFFDKISSKHVSDFSKTCSPLQSVTGHKLKNFGTATLPVEVSKFCRKFKFQIVKGLKHACILGNDFLSEFGVKLDFGKKTMNIHSNVIPLRPQHLKCQSITSLVRLPEKTTIPAQSYVEVPAYVNRVQLIDQDCVVQPLSNTPYFCDEPGLILLNSVSRPNDKGHLPAVIVNTTTRDHTLPARQVIGLAEVLDASEINPVEQNKQDEQDESSQEINVASHVELDPAMKIQKADLSHVPEHQKNLIEQLIERNSDLFSKSETDLGRTDLVTMKIDTRDSTPIKQRPYRLPFSQRQMVEDHINELLKAGVIQPSQSPWASPIVIVDKKDGGKRYCVDYRKLNQVTVKNSYPLPRIDDILASLEGSKYFTSLDLKSGYWQIAMADQESIDKTAFTCFLGLYSWNVLPFGLTNAPALFSELMNKVLQGIQHKFAIAYIDDVIIFSKTFEEHLKHIEDVFDRLRKAGLKLKMSKCDFLKQEVKYLGHIVSASGIQPDQSKVEVIRELKPPTTVKGVRSFIGMCSYYRRFIPNFAKIAKPLTELTKKNARFIWTDECQKSFETLRVVLTDAPILAYPDTNKPYKLYTDASNHSIGAALIQETEQGERVIQYLSHQLNKSQLNWPIIEKEAYAIVYAVQKLRPYLLGSKFTIMTDHKPLKHLFTAEMRNPRIQRWAIIIDEYGCDIKYVTGRQNTVADSLSRLEPQRDEDEPINVAIIDSDHAPRVELDPTVEACSSDENTDPKKKFQEFLAKHPDIETLQSEDDEIQKIIRILKNPEDPNFRDTSAHYVVLENILYRITDTSKCTPHPGLQLCIPKFLQKPLVEEIHSGYFGGHLGIDKTYDKLRSRYYWSGMYRDVINHLKTCVACNMRKLKKQRPPLQDMQIPKYPFEMIAIDTCGPFPQSYSGNRFIINIVDLFSGWPESFATDSKSAETVAQILIEHIIPRHACPRLILSDNGTEFCNAVIDQISAFFNIKHIRTSVYHPQSNGRCEKYHRVQNDMLAKLVSRNQRNWDTKLPSILSAYRTAKNDTTKHSPFFIVHGRDPVLPMDTLLSPKFKYQGEEYVPTMLENLSQAYHEVRHNLALGHEKNKTYYDRKSKLVKFKVGDMVYFRDPSTAPGSTTKLTSHWKPYFRIVKALSDVTFVIKHQLEGGTKTVNAQNLRLADPNTPWCNISDETTHINQKHVEKSKSQIPIRTQPPRSSKLSYYAESEARPVPVGFSEPALSDTQFSTSPGHSKSDMPSEDEDDIPLSRLAKRIHNPSSDEDDEIPLAKLAKKIQEEREKCKKRDLESPLPDAKRVCESLDSDLNPDADEYVPVKRDRESDSEGECPPNKITAEDSPSDSDISDLECTNVDINAVQCKHVATDSVKQQKSNENEVTPSSSLNAEQKLEMFKLLSMNMTNISQKIENMATMLLK